MTKSVVALVALHGLRLKGFALSASIADLFEVDAGTLEVELKAAADDDFVVFRETGLVGWSLTLAGRHENERLLAEELDRYGARSQVRACYDAFMALNVRLLAACTRWQVKDGAAGVLNDHLDDAYDQAVIDELEAINAEVQTILGALPTELDRFAIHPRRLTAAMVKIRAGEHEWFTKPLIDSYHTVWFELHEDLLASLGLDRASEAGR